LLELSSLRIFVLLSSFNWIKQNYCAGQLRIRLKQILGRPKWRKPWVHLQTGPKSWKLQQSLQPNRHQASPSHPERLPSGQLIRSMKILFDTGMVIDGQNTFRQLLDEKYEARSLSKIQLVPGFA
jgi:hypothetical protein